jgi:predicted PurR-regulated permease PerM
VIEVSLPIVHVFIFAALLLVSWVGGSIMTSLNYWSSTKTHQMLERRFNDLQDRHDRLVREHDELQSQKWQMDAKIRELLGQVDRLSAELHAYRNRDENQGIAGRG